MQKLEEEGSFEIRQQLVSAEMKCLIEGLVKEH